jgi:hypothetical protein
MLKNRQIRMKKPFLLLSHKGGGAIQPKNGAWHISPSCEEGLGERFFITLTVSPTVQDKSGILPFLPWAPKGQNFYHPGANTGRF